MLLPELRGGRSHDKDNRNYDPLSDRYNVLVDARIEMQDLY